ncbi:hypothetical protein ACU686_34080 [Yinghuangia aomiensis]
MAAAQGVRTQAETTGNQDRAGRETGTVVEDSTPACGPPCGRPFCSPLSFSMPPDLCSSPDDQDLPLSAALGPASA